MIAKQPTMDDIINCFKIFLLRQTAESFSRGKREGLEMAREILMEELRQERYAFPHTKGLTLSIAKLDSLLQSLEKGE
jgi:hypothetical protein